MEVHAAHLLAFALFPVLAQIFYLYLLTVALLLHQRYFLLQLDVLPPEPADL